MQQEVKKLVLDLKEILTSEFRDNFVSMVLYGSAVNGPWGKESDIDVCLVFNEMPHSRYKRNKIVFGSLQKLREKKSYLDLRQQSFLAEVVPLVFTKEEITQTRPIFLDMVDTSEIIVDDGTFTAKLNQIKARMKKLGSKKIYTEDGHWFWILKPDLKLGEVFSL